MKILLITLAFAFSLSLIPTQSYADLTPQQQELVINTIRNGDFSVVTQMTCECHSLDKQFEAACSSLPTTQCSRVGNIVCIPNCHF